MVRDPAWESVFPKLLADQSFGELTIVTAQDKVAHVKEMHIYKTPQEALNMLARRRGASAKA